MKSDFGGSNFSCFIKKKKKHNLFSKLFTQKHNFFFGSMYIRKSARIHQDIRSGYSCMVVELQILLFAFIFEFSKVSKVNIHTVFY